MKCLDILNVLPAIGKLNEPVLYFFQETIESFEKAENIASVSPDIFAYLTAVEGFHQRLLKLREVIESDIEADIQEFNDLSIEVSIEDEESPDEYIKVAREGEKRLMQNVKNVLKGQIDRAELFLGRGEKVKEKFYTKKVA